MEFSKYHCGGNSFVLIDTRQQPPKIPQDISELVKNICNPKTGIGADGVVFLTNTTTDELLGMHIYNQDGSEAEMCGNALRCLGLYIHKQNIYKQFTSQTLGELQFWIKTEAGNKKIILKLEDNQVIAVGFETVPGLIKKLGKNIVGVSMGNPHIVFVEEEIDNIRQDLYENNNVELVQIISRDLLKVRVFERGVGETTSCGTGACAAFTATYMLELCNDKVTLQFPGEEVEVGWENNEAALGLIGKPPVCIIDNGIYQTS